MEHGHRIATTDDRGSTAAPASTADHVDTGRRALLACDWDTAAAAFGRARDRDGGGEAIEGLGKARYWQGAHDRAFDLLEEAFRAYRDEGRHRDATRVAVHLAQLHGLVHGNASAVAGWLAHAGRSLQRHGRACVEGGWVAVFRACIAADPAERERHARSGVATGRDHDDAALEYDALAYLGKALVEQGDTAGGMALLDEAAAAAVGGVVDDPWAVGEIYCTLFAACEGVGDVRRAEDWLAAVDRYVDRTDELPIRALCRMHYGGLLVAAGRWSAAEAELTTSLAIYDRTYRGSRGDPLVRLADLRVRQGRWEEARRLLEDHEDHHLAWLPRARLAQADGRFDLALDLVERHLADHGAGPPGAHGRALRVEVALAAGDHVGARDFLDDLVRHAATASGVAPQALAAWSSARVVRVTGSADDDEVVRAQRAALSALAAADLAWELARARLELAEFLAERRPEVALDEVRLARRALERLGGVDADRAARLERLLGGDGTRASRARPADVLTPRQREVLDLVAEGLGNAAIADRLCISPRTVEDHVRHVLRALGVDNRAQAVAVALRPDPQRDIRGDIRRDVGRDVLGRTGSRA